MSYETLCILWFLLLGVLLVGYAILDGFDLGVGVLHLLVPKSDTERRLMMNSIGPLWDGNEVWLVTFGGAMFAMFPECYASLFSGFYTAFMLLLFALIFRAVSLEFRSKQHHAFWRRVWDVGFFVGSGLAALLFGVAAGNAVRGVGLDGDGNFTTGLIDQLHPYPVLVGGFTVAMVTMHGSIYLYLKTEGGLRQRLRRWMWRTFFVFLALFLAVTSWTLLAVPTAVENLNRYPVLWAVPVLNALAIANIPRAIHQGRAGYAFVSSCCTIAAFVFLLMAAIYPNLVFARNDPANSVTVFNAASSPLTLKIGLLIVLIGMPCVASYTAIIYWAFRGKVQLDDHSY